jgi:hypothetical protein
MFAVQTTGRFRVAEHPDPVWRFRIDGDPQLAPVDYFRTRSGAEYAARLLNSGAATIDPHGLIGCRVVVK